MSKEGTNQRVLVSNSKETERVNVGGVDRGGGWEADMVMIMKMTMVFYTDERPPDGDFQGGIWAISIRIFLSAVSLKANSFIPS